MRILLCCELYAPSVGGVQQVAKQLAERLVLRGHEVTVATTKLPTRRFDELNGVKILEFQVDGNLVHGMQGELSDYRCLVMSEIFDVIMIIAAQQWTFDAVWPVLSKIKAGKVFVPCGFSGLYEPSYAEYFRQLPAILRQFDHLIFYSSDYRDIDFAKEHGIDRFSVIPNGASEIEFAVDPDPLFRQRHGIDSDELLFLTVGSLIRLKGHLEVATAFLTADLDGIPATLVLNANEWGHREERSPFRMLQSKFREYSRVIRHIHKRKGFRFALEHVGHGLLNKVGIRRGRYAGKEITYRDELMQIIDQIHHQNRNKRVLLTELPRAEVVQAFLNADLFVFASHVEYSPLVLFESAAAGTPFLSVPVGNSAEIARWTGGGVICPAPQDDKGYTKVDPKVLGEHWSRLVKDRTHLRQLGEAGKKNWAARFTWEKITSEYEQIFQKVSAVA